LCGTQRRQSGRLSGNHRDGPWLRGQPCLTPVRRPRQKNRHQIRHRVGGYLLPQPSRRAPAVRVNCRIRRGQCSPRIALACPCSTIATFGCLAFYQRIQSTQSLSHRQPRVSQPCHNEVRMRGVGRDGLRRLRLVNVLRDLLRDREIRPMSDWGSSGRRFKSCQPDTGQSIFLPSR